MARKLLVLAGLLALPAALLAQSPTPLHLDAAAPGQKTVSGTCDSTAKTQVSIQVVPAASGDPEDPSSTDCTKNVFSTSVAANLAAGDYIRATQGTQTATAIVAPISYQGGEIEHLIVGVHGVFGPDTQPTAKAFGDFYIENGIFAGEDTAKNCSSQSLCLGSPWRVWSGIQVYGTAGTAQQFLTAEGAATKTALASNTDLKNVVENAAAEGGLAFRITSPDINLAGIPRDEPGRSVVEVLTRYGVATPIQSATPPAPAVFCTANCGANPPSAPAYTVVNPPVRTRLLNSWGVGLRFQTFFLGHDHAVEPSRVDLLLGQDENVTAGHLHGGVLQVAGFLPLPKADFVDLTFSAETALPSRGTGFQALPSNFTPVPTPTTTTGTGFTQTVGTWPTADVLRIGVAVDLIDFFKNHISFSGK